MQLTNRQIGNRIIKQMQEYTIFRNLPQPVRSRWVQHFRHIPALYFQNLYQPITLQQVFYQKTLWIEYLLSHNVLQAVFRDDPVREQKRLSRTFKGEITLFEAITNSPQIQNRLNHHQIEYQSYSETDPKNEKVLLRFFGLSDESLELYEKKQLTVLKLLITQPWIIINI